MESKWSEATIARAVVKQLFQNAVLAVPCCGWTGHEADLLVVTKDLRVIDVEIKISRADLKADMKKDKWWADRHWSRRHLPREPVQWPPKVWKHYYCMPADIWKPELLQFVPAASGVVLIQQPHGSANVAFASVKACKPNRDAQKLSAADAIDIARLAGLRMWDALHRESTLKEKS